jgi:hypothetical protein
MNRLLFCFVLMTLPLWTGCGGGPTPDPEEPVKAVMKAVSDFVAVLETLEKEAQNPDVKEVEKALVKAADALDKMDAAMTDVKDRLKISKLTKPERSAYNTAERQKELDKIAERVRAIVPKVELILNRKDLNEKTVKKFRESWARIRVRAAELNAEIAKWSEEN